MKNLTKHVLIAAFAVGFSSAHAGEKAGNGGIAAVCRSNGKVTAAYLLDLMEAEQGEEPIQIARSSAPYSQQLEDAIKRFPHWVAPFKSEIAQLKMRSLKNSTKVVFKTNPAFGLPDPKDFNPKVTMKECPFEVVGLYNDQTSTLRIDQEIFAKLSETDKAAFFAHEYIYRAARRHGTDTSDTSRLLNGQLFAKKPNANRFFELMVSKEALAVGINCDISVLEHEHSPTSLTSGTLLSRNKNVYRPLEQSSNGSLELFISQVQLPSGSRVDLTGQIYDKLGLNELPYVVLYLSKKGNQIGVSAGGGASTFLAVPAAPGVSVSADCNLW